MKISFASVLLKGFGTAALALGFVVLVGRVPFMPQPTAGPGGEFDPSDDRPIPRLAVGEASRTLPVVNADEPVAVTGDMGKTLGLFTAQFASTDASPGFTTSEHRVPGHCEGAGMRYIEQVCAGCQLLSGGNPGASPSMLLWLDPASPDGAVHAVSMDCVDIGADGVPVVGALVMNDPALDLAEEGSSLARDIVPLLPGATRLAAIEMGDWLAVFDDVARPGSALSDMATALVNKGWRETEDPEAGGLPAFAGERVFTKNANVFCVISLSKQGGSYQLLTVVSSGARG